MHEYGRLLMGKGGPKNVFLSASTLCLYHLQYWLALSLYNWLQIPLVFCFVWYAGEVPGEIIGAPPLRSVSPAGGPRAQRLTDVQLVRRQKEIAFRALKIGDPIFNLLSLTTSRVHQQYRLPLVSWCFASAAHVHHGFWNHW